jgi:cytochrome oxidase Cu insertion factor (SCO1/SenC/PrrC family)
MIRKLSLVLLMLAVAEISFAQFAGKRIAPFQIVLDNGKAFNATQLKPGAVVLVYFSPDCDHCQNFTKDLLKNFSVVGNKQVVMITPQSMEMLRPFIARFNLAAYPNIKVGTEGTSYLVRKYYNIMHYPFIALYDKNGQQVKTFEGEQPHTDIFKAIKSI